MKVFSAFLFLLAVPALATPISYRLDTASVNLAATFPTTPQISGFTQVTSIQVDNQSNAEIEINCSSTTKPSINNGHGIYVATTSSFGSPNNASFGAGNCFIRAYTGTGTTGVLRVFAYGW